MKHIILLLLLLLAIPAWAEERDANDTVVAQVLPVNNAGQVKDACMSLNLQPGNAVAYTPDKDGQIFIITPLVEDMVLTIYKLDKNSNRLEPFILQHNFSKDSWLLLQVDVPAQPSLEICLENKFYVQHCWQVQDGSLPLDKGFALLPPMNER